MNDERLAAFIEYVIRPLSDDWRQILDRIKGLNIGLTQESVRKICFSLGIWHLIGELIRATSYILIVWIVCQTLPHLLCP